MPLSLCLQLHYLGLQLTVPETCTEHRTQSTEHRGDGGRGLDTVTVSLCVDVRQRVGVVALQATAQLQLIPEAHTHTQRGRESIQPLVPVLGLGLTTRPGRGQLFCADPHSLGSYAQSPPQLPLLASVTHSVNAIHTIHAYYTYIHTYIQYIHTYIHACIHTYIHACIHTYIHAYIHTYIQYIHTYIHTYIQYIHTYMYIHRLQYCTLSVLTSDSGCGTLEVCVRT